MADLAASIAGPGPGAGAGAEADDGDGHAGDAGWSNERPRLPEDDMVTYVKGVDGALASALDDESRRALVENVFEELRQHEASLACTRRMSYALESLLRHAEAAQLAAFLGNMKKYFGFVVTNRQGSHVLQTLLGRVYAALYERSAAAPTRAADEDEDEDDGDDAGASEAARRELRTIVLDLAKTLVVKEVWIDLVYDPCATHVMRALLQVLAGVDPREKRKSGDPLTPSRFRETADKEMNASLIAFLAAMSKWSAKDVKDACENTHASPAVQIIVQYCPPRYKAWKATVDKAIGTREDESGDAAVTAASFWACAEHRVCSHLVQVIVASCDNAFFDESIFPLCVQKDAVADKLKHPVANHVLQTVLGRMHTDEQVEAALEALEPLLETTILGSRLGILWRLCEAAVPRSPAVQSRLGRSVLRALRARRDAAPAGRAGAPKGAIQYLLGLEERGPAPAAANNDAGDAAGDEGPENDEDNEMKFTQVRVSVLGARVAGAMLQFAPESVRALLESLASMDAAWLKQLACDPVGGKHVLEPLMDAPSGALWAKQRVLSKLKDSLAQLAADKFGCHVLRKAFDGGTIKDRTAIVKALARKQQRLAGSKAGAGLLKHCKVALYAQHPDQWVSAQSHVKAKSKKQSLANFMIDLENTGDRAASRSVKRRRAEEEPSSHKKSRGAGGDDEGAADDFGEPVAKRREEKPKKDKKKKTKKQLL